MAQGSVTTTNHLAEYQGLLTGLKAATVHDWHPLEVIGDSQLILGQMAAYRPPKNLRLLELYAQARRLADTLHVQTWTHHRRAYNCMADAAANLAMDHAASSQVFHPTARCGHAELVALLADDFSHWQIGHIATS